MANIKILKALFSFLGGIVLAGVIVYGINVEKNKTLSKATCMKVSQTIV